MIQQFQFQTRILDVDTFRKSVKEIQESSLAAIVCKSYNPISAKTYLTDVGIDLRPTGNYRITNQPQLVPTGVKVAVFCPCAFFALTARSSLPKKRLAISHSIGIIDPEYRGEIYVWLHSIVNHEEINITPDDKIAQLLLIPYIPVGLNTKVTCTYDVVFVQSEEIFNEWENIFPSNRGSSGFGSTG